MSRTAICITAVLLATACARQSGPSTTTVTSGAVTARTDGDGATMRLADEMCTREAACNHIGSGARYRTEEACMSDQGVRAPLQVSRWTCAPPPNEAAFEVCLAAIRGERCDTPLTHADELVACRSGAVCGR